MSHSYTVHIDSSDEDKSSTLPPTKESILLSKNWTTRPGLGITTDSPEVECSIQILNYTTLTLLKPQIKCKNGAMHAKAQRAEFIEPASRDAFLTKGETTFNIATSGSYGTASWFISGMDRRLVIMWSAARMPFYKNWLAVGFTKVGKTEDTSRNNSWFDEMYGVKNAESSGILDFKRKAFRRSSANTDETSNGRLKVMVCRKSKGLEVRGTMTGDKKVQVQIKLYQPGK